MGSKGPSTGSDSIYGPGDDTSMQIEIGVPNHMVGIIIGKGGENVSKMILASGATMQIAKEADMKPGDTFRQIVISGKKDNARDLKRRIEECVEAQKLRDAQNNASKVQEKEFNYPFIMKVQVPNDKVGVIIGKMGQTVKMIQDRTGTNIQIPNQADEDNPQVRTLSIGGHSKEAIEAGQMEVFTTLQNFHINGANMAAQKASSNCMYIQVPDDRVGLIIGKGGITIRDMQNKFNVKIQIPPSADPGTMPPVRTVSIQGAQDGQYGARYEIENVIGVGPGGTTQVAHAQSAQPAAGQYMQQQQVYGGAAYGQHDYYGQPQYQQQYQQQMYGQAPVASEPAPVQAIPDATAYYNDFWIYASYYGEAAARLYYGAWSPPEGTLPPEGTVIPQPTGTSSEPAQENTTGAGPTDTAEPASESKDEATESFDKKDVNPSEKESDAGATTEAKESTETVATAASTDDAWESYKKSVCLQCSYIL